MTQEKIEQEFIDWYYSNYEIIEFEELAREAYLAGRKANEDRRCEDCKHSREVLGHKIMLQCSSLFMFTVRNDFYCKYWERKDDTRKN